MFKRHISCRLERGLVQLVKELHLRNLTDSKQLSLYKPNRIVAIRSKRSIGWWDITASRHIAKLFSARQMRRLSSNKSSRQGPHSRSLPSKNLSRRAGVSWGSADAPAHATHRGNSVPDSRLPATPFYTLCIHQPNIATTSLLTSSQTHVTGTHYVGMKPCLLYSSSLCPRPLSPCLLDSLQIKRYRIKM